jgi:regulator of sirC expression with transglutaminase-like and TPR domain
VDPTETFAALVRREHVPLDESALAIAAHAWPTLDMAAELARLDGMASRLTVPTRVELNRVLFGEFGLRGNTDEYYLADNSFLNRVIDTKLGIPISLAILMIEVGRRAGVSLAGINAPGHFLVRDDADGAFLDPFASGATVANVDGPPADTVGILARMLNNLRSIYISNGELGNLIWVLRLRTLLPGAGPEAGHELVRANARLN